MELEEVQSTKRHESTECAQTKQITSQTSLVSLVRN